MKMRKTLPVAATVQGEGLDRSVGTLGLGSVCGLQLKPEAGRRPECRESLQAQGRRSLSLGSVSLIGKAEWGPVNFCVTFTTC